jgi:hypothetical protein
MALLFAVGSMCFLIAAFPDYTNLVGGRASRLQRHIDGWAGCQRS